MNIVSSFNDILYGEIKFPSLIATCLSTPEINRLKDIRLSNINCDQTPGLSNVSRFEHIVGCTYLAYTFAQKNSLPEKDLYELCIAAMYHDVATPPFGHSFELVLPDFNHEIETRNIIMGSGSSYWKSIYELQYFQESYPRLSEIIKRFNRKADCIISLENIANYTIGKGKLGSLIKHDLDIDNLDNIIRATFYSGHVVDKEIPLKIMSDCKLTNEGFLLIPSYKKKLIEDWKRAKYLLYDMFIANTHDLCKELYLQFIFKYALQKKVLLPDDWALTDRLIINKLADSDITQDRLRKLNSNKLPTILFKGWCLEKDYLNWAKIHKRNNENIERDLNHIISHNKRDFQIIFALKKDRRFIKINNIAFEDSSYLFDIRDVKEPPYDKRKYFIFILGEGILPPKLDSSNKPIINDYGRKIKLTKSDINNTLQEYFERSGLKVVSEERPKQAVL